MRSARRRDDWLGVVAWAGMGGSVRRVGNVVLGAPVICCEECGRPTWRHRLCETCQTCADYRATKLSPREAEHVRREMSKLISIEQWFK